MNNPFRLKKQADDMEPNEIASLFGEPPGLEKFLQPTHHFLLGGRGSGKTTLLRAVCSSVVDKRTQRNKVPFFGVYVPFKHFEVGRFVRSFELTGSASPFWLYFASELFLRIMEQNQDSSRFNALSDEFDAIVRRVIFGNRKDLGSSTLQDLKNIRAKAFESVHKHPVDAPAQISDINITQAEILSALGMVAELFKRANMPKIAILVDGYDYIGSLAQEFSWLLEREYLSLFCVKCACRCLPWRAKGEPIGPVPDERSIKMFCLDQDPESPQYYDLLGEVIQNAIRVAGYAKIDPYALLPAEDDPHFYSGFKSLAALSSGNTLLFLDLCEIAWDEAQKAGDPKLPKAISPKFQHMAALKRSRQWFDLDLSNDIGDEFREFRSFIFWSGRAAKDSQKDPYKGSTFLIEQDPSPPAKQVIRKGILTRHLGCSPEDFLRTNVGGGDPPARFSLHRMYAPRCGFPAWNVGELSLSTEDVERWMKEPIQSDYDPEKRKMGSKSKIAQPVQGDLEPSLFTSTLSDSVGSSEAPRNILPVFISHPITVPQEERELLRKRVQELKTAVTKIRKDDMADRNRMKALDDLEFCIAAKDLWETDASNFRFNIPKQIKKSCYTVHDITYLTPGVSFEIGVACGYYKPFFLYWDTEDRPMDSQVLHNAIRDQDIKHWPPDEQTSFKDWFRRAIDNHGLKCGGRVDCCTRFGEKCSYDSVQPSRPLAFVSFQPRNRAARDSILEVLDEFGISAVENALPSGLDADHRLCLAIKHSSVCFIDVSEGQCDFAFESGLAQAAGKKTILFYDEDLQGGCDPCVMASAQKIRFSQSRLQKLKGEVLEFLKLTGLGGKRREE